MCPGTVRHRFPHQLVWPYRLRCSAFPKGDAVMRGVMPAIIPSNEIGGEETLTEHHAVVFRIAHYLLLSS